MTHHVMSFKACRWLVTAHLLFISCIDSKVYDCVASLSLSDKPTWDFATPDNQKKKLREVGEIERVKRGKRWWKEI